MTTRRDSKGLRLGAVSLTHSTLYLVAQSTMVMHTRTHTAAQRLSPSLSRCGSTGQICAPCFLPPPLQVLVDRAAQYTALVGSAGTLGREEVDNRWGACVCNAGDRDARHPRPSMQWQAPCVGRAYMQPDACMHDWVDRVGRQRCILLGVDVVRRSATPAWPGPARPGLLRLPGAARLCALTSVCAVFVRMRMRMRRLRDLVGVTGMTYLADGVVYVRDRYKSECAPDHACTCMGCAGLHGMAGYKDAARGFP